jgi:5-methylcytosine-specific restriction enzyme A
MKRRRLTTEERKLLLSGNAFTCHICQGRIDIGQAWEAEHVIPLAQGGEDGGTNLRPAHVKCHARKTAQDAADTARAKRREARHLGIRKPRTIQKWRRFNGDPVHAPRDR